jgi:hypothetical protein
MVREIGCKRGLVMPQDSGDLGGNGAARVCAGGRRGRRGGAGGVESGRDSIRLVGGASDLHARVLFEVVFAVGFQVVEQVDVVGVVELKPFGDGGDGTAAALCKDGHNALPKLRIRDFPYANHGFIVPPPTGSAIGKLGGFPGVCFAAEFAL